MFAYLGAKYCYMNPPESSILRKLGTFWHFNLNARSECTPRMALGPHVNGSVCNVGKCDHFHFYLQIRL